ncbi:serine/threonine-protein kinase AFC3-like isoform X3 [Panicum virgatum]|uniref:serine/threonine-protein kinase AFC3-like isoform X3 n=1 Tax=Panicum virgatum TaxID=38727 RepID=UPI0019D64DA1|nr:serine/threonine-protein kinase AFC3-like isoform X3 [Panicum virgatum]
MESSRSRKRTRQAYDDPAAPPPEREVVPRGGESPPWREDDRDGHYVFDLGENLTRRYKILSKMGEGTFGRVLECWDRETREYVAIKVVRSIRKYRDAAMIEIDVLNRLAENEKYRSLCVQIQRWFDYRNHICIVFEKLGPSLYDFLKRNRYQPFPVELVREFGRQLLESVAYMHELRLIHTDLKPENILLVSSEYIKVPSSKKSSQDEMHFKCLPKSSAVKLIDFGSTAFDNQEHNSIVSTRHYRAPEIILGLGWSFPCDIWSAGCILVELCSGEALFQTHENLEHLAMMERVLGPIPEHMIRNASSSAQKYFRRATRLNWPEGAVSRESIRADLVSRSADHSRAVLVDLLYSLLRFEPSERLSAQEALDHPFFRNPT